MRITDKMMVDNAITYMNENRDRMNVYNERASSGKMFQNISDDPSSAAMSLKLRSTLQTNQVYVDTDSAVNEYISTNDSAFGQLIDVATRVANLGAQGKSDALSSKERYGLGAEVDALLQQAVETGNTQHDGKYIFSGYKVNTQPFTTNTNTAGQITSVNYNGDNGNIQQDISPGQKITTNFSDDTHFTDFYNALISVRDALLNNTPGTQLDQALGALSTSTDAIKTDRTTNGARQRQIRLVTDTMEQTKTNLKSLLSQNEDANMAEAISMLTQQETVYKTVLEVSSRAISQSSLFDLLR
jgi:flagellar hook-associated protein 3 FlgL